MAVAVFPRKHNLAKQCTCNDSSLFSSNQNAIQFIIDTMSLFRQGRAEKSVHLWEETQFCKSSIIIISISILMQCSIFWPSHWVSHQTSCQIMVSWCDTPRLPPLDSVSRWYPWTSGLLAMEVAVPRRLPLPMGVPVSLPLRTATTVAAPEVPPPVTGLSRRWWRWLWWWWPWWWWRLWPALPLSTSCWADW